MAVDALHPYGGSRALLTESVQTRLLHVAVRSRMRQSVLAHAVAARPLASRCSFRLCPGGDATSPRTSADWTDSRVPLRTEPAK
jgi:hypothetical protein